jgi:hypothetical protein
MGSREELEARLRAEAQAQAPPPLEKTRNFLRSYCADADGFDEIRDEAARAAAYNPRPLQDALQAIESVLADPPTNGSIGHMVAVDGNRQLADPSDQGALAYLSQLADLLREVLASSGSG